MGLIYIFGHKKPDTDSVTAAISLDYLKKQLGYDTEARILDNLNLETKFALNYFNVESPKYLNDIRLKIKDIDYLKDCYINEHSSIYEAFNYMSQKNVSTLPVINDKEELIGLVSIRDIIKYQIKRSKNVLCTSYDNIKFILECKEITNYNQEISGNIIKANYKNVYEDKIMDSSSIVIIDKESNIIDYAIEMMVPLIILTENIHLTNEQLKKANNNRVNVIESEDDKFSLYKKLELANYVSEIVLKDNIISFNKDITIDELMLIVSQYKYTNYPITDNYKCIGMLQLSNIDKSKKKKVILVDHNEEQQSIEGLEEAEILEIIDHHKIGAMSTDSPISFRNAPYGSTNTIIYEMYKENNIDIPKNIAGLMLSGIISDTLLFKSPTTCDKDKQYVKELAKIAEIDYEEYGLKMIKAGASLKNKTLEEIVYTDFKNFTIDEKKIGVAQVISTSFEEFEENKQEYISLLDKIAKNNEYFMVLFCITDIITQGSYIIYNGSVESLVKVCFNLDDIYQGYFIKNCISRKKQIIPNIIRTLEKK